MLQICRFIFYRPHMNEHILFCVREKTNKKIPECEGVRAGKPGEELNNEKLDFWQFTG